jgi:centromeric protein E
LFLFGFILQLAYLPDRKREYGTEDDDFSLDSEFSTEAKLDSHTSDEPIRFDRRNRKRGMLGWFKLKVIFLLCII